MLLFGLAGLPFSLTLFTSYSLRLMISPLMGLLGLNVILLAIYNTFDLSFQASLLVAAMLLALFTIALFQSASSKRVDFAKVWKPLAVVAIIGTICAVTLNIAEIVNRDLATPLIAGTDQAGYATNADWMLHHLASERPTRNPFDTGQIHSEFVFSYYPRLLSFAGLAIVALVFRIPTFFAYQTFCAAAFAIGVLSLAAVVTNRIYIAVTAIAFLSVSYWFDYSYSGFLGKLIGFPASLLLAIVLLRHFDGDRRLEWSALSVFSSVVVLSGIPLGHSATGTGLFVISFVVPFWALRLVVNRQPDWSGLFKEAATVGFCLFVLIDAFGLLAHYLPLTGFPRSRNEWGYIFLYANDLDAKVNASMILALLAQLFLIGISIATRNFLPAALALGPFAVLGTLYLLDHQSLALQLAGYAYPAAICAVAILADRSGFAFPFVRPYAVAPVLVVVVGIGIALPRLPRFVDALTYFAAPIPDRPLVFLSREFTEVARVAKNSAVMVEVDTPFHAVALMAALERQVGGFQWGENAWWYVGGYAGVVRPDYKLTANYVLYRRGDPRASRGRQVLTTPNFELVE